MKDVGVSREFDERGATPREAPEIGNARSSRRTPDAMQRGGLG
jgi:hypothetical protein